MHKLKGILLSSCLLLAVASYGGQAMIANGENHGGGIVLPESPYSVEEVAASELAEHVRKVTGVALPIVKGAEAAKGVTCGYRIGRAASIKPLPGDVPDSCRFAMADGFLEIAGVDGDAAESGPWVPAGTLFGVYHYLTQSLGVRWLWPGETGTYAPRKAELTPSLPTPDAYVPVLQFAAIQGANAAKNPELYRWARRVMRYRQSRGFKYAGKAGHAFEDWGEIYGKEHPEWFCLLNGKRVTKKPFNMCVSNAEFQDQVVKNWLEICKEKGQLLSVNVKENDNPRRCQCENCKAWDGPDERGLTGRYANHVNVSDRYSRFAVEVQKKAAAINPDATVGFYAYQGYFKAPRLTKLNAGCQVGLVPDVPFPRSKRNAAFVREELDRWVESGATLYLRPNYFLGGYTMPEVWYDEFVDELQHLVKHGLVGYSGDALNCQFASNGVNYYVALRAIDNPSGDPEVFFREYTDAFGPAAPEIAAYLKHWQKYMKDNAERINDIYEHGVGGWYFHGWRYPPVAHKVVPIQDLNASMGYLDRALKLAEGDADATAKVAFLKCGLEHGIKCAETATVFDDKNAGREQRIAALMKLREYRKTLPPFACDERRLWTGECSWKIDGKELQTIKELRP